jgi:hypothetical protein
MRRAAAELLPGLSEPSGSARYSPGRTVPQATIQGGAMTVSASIPPGLAVLVDRRAIGMGDWATRGELDIRVDGRRRLRIRRGRRGNEIVLESRLVSLPTSAPDCEALLARAMLHVTAGAGQQVGMVALSADGQGLLLQAELEGGDSARFEAALEAFLNELDYWNSVLGGKRT